MLYLQKKNIMQVGDKVKWKSSDKEMEGLFMQCTDGIAEIICYKMGELNCHLRVFVNTEAVMISLL
jgi:hypothetical protein